MFPEYRDSKGGWLCSEKPRLWDKYNLLARLAADPRTAEFVPPLVSPGQVEQVLACGREVLVRGYLAYAGQHPLAHQIDPVLVDATPTSRLWRGADPGTVFARELADYRQTLACYSQIFGFDEKKIRCFWFLQEEVQPFKTSYESSLVWRRPLSTVTALADGRLLVDTQTFLWEDAQLNAPLFTRQSAILWADGQMKLQPPWTDSRFSGWSHHYGENLRYLRQIIDRFRLAAEVLGLTDQPLVAELVGGQLVQARPLPDFIDHLVILDEAPLDLRQHSVLANTRHMPKIDFQKSAGKMITVISDGPLRSLPDLRGVGALRFYNGDKILSHGFLSLLLAARHLKIPVYLK